MMTIPKSAGGPSARNPTGISLEPRGLGKSEKRPSTLQDSLDSIKKDLHVLEQLRAFGGASHSPYITDPSVPACCQPTGAHGVAHTGKPKDQKVDKKTITAIWQFSNELKRLTRSKGSGMSLGYLNTIQAYAQALLKRPKDHPVVRHDINILVSETIAEILGKVAKHPDEKKLKFEATNVLQLLRQHFGQYLQDTGSEYKKFFRGDGTRNISGPDLYSKLENYLKEVDHAQKTYSDAPTSTPAPRQAYQAAAGIILSENKPDFPATRVVGKRVDRHNHPGPYDDNGEVDKTSDLAWHVRVHDALQVDASDMMQIPHSMGPESFNGRPIQELTANTRHAYYSDLKAVTEFFGKDRTLIEAYNKLKPEQRKVLNVCCTSTPVDPSRLEDIKEVAAQFAKNVAEAQLTEGRTHVEVTFGEITGYKPGVPQKMLTDFGGHTTKTDKQNAFVEGSAAVITEIFKAAEKGIAAALKEYAAKNNSLEGIRTMVRTVYHSDALPNDQATERNANIKPDGTHKEVTTMANIKAFIRAIDNRLSEPSDGFPEGVTHEHHLQCAHLMGTSIEPNNFMDGSRATEMHRLFKEFRENLVNLRVTADASWLTASARAMNFGMAEFFRKSDDKDINHIAELIEIADKLSNDGFMQLHGGERYFESHLLNGDESDGTVLDMALMRAAQKKAVRTYHTLLGALNTKLGEPGVARKLLDYINKGVDANNDVAPGNYPGLLLQLDKEAIPGSKQDATPIVWGSDNLTPAEARSGDLKVLQYTSQHAPFELIMATLGGITNPSAGSGDSQSSAARVLRSFMSGGDEQYWGSIAPISGEGIRDGRRPADPEADPNPRPVNDLLHNVRAPQDFVFPWSEKRGAVIQTDTPVIQTDTPVIQTYAPVIPTVAPVIPTYAPVIPTDAPVIQTDAPVIQTGAPQRSAIIDPSTGEESGFLSFELAAPANVSDAGKQTADAQPPRNVSDAGTQTDAQPPQNVSDRGTQTDAQPRQDRVEAEFSDTASVESWKTAPEE
jgi:hypothetical protein